MSARAAVEGRGGGDELAAEVLLGVDDPVEHHRPQAVGEAFGVAEPDEGAVGEADVGDRVAADRHADRFEVRHRSVDADVTEQRRGLGGARLDGCAERLVEDGMPGVVGVERGP